MQIRKYRDSDEAALSRICLVTGDSGHDATALYDDGALLGFYYALPYSRLCPDFAFVLADDGDALGYVVGAPDSAEFGRRCEREWFPEVRSRLTQPTPADTSADAKMLRRIFAGHPRENPFPEYPAHLHINLLPSAQGKGWGRKLMERLLDRMRAEKIPAVHLGVGGSNDRAIGFYTRIGFTKIEEEQAVIWMGIKLSS